MWQSEAIAGIQLAFAIVLWPTIRNQSAQVPRRTSVPTAFGLWTIASIYATLDLWSAVLMSALTATAWSFVAVMRPVRAGGDQ